MKKIIGLITFIICLFIILNINAYAASMGMSINKASAYVGDSFSVTISGINGKVSISGNSNVTLDKTGNQWVDGSLTITGTAKSVGTGKITVTPLDVTTTGAEPEEVTASASRTITIKEKETPPPTNPDPKPETKPDPKPETKPDPKPTTPTKTEPKEEEPKKEDKFYISNVTLKGIKENGEQVDITLSPAFNKDIYEYTCNIGADIQKIDLQKDAGEYTNSIIVTGLEELKEGENIIALKLSAENHQAKTYTIKVTKEKQELIETLAPVEENKQEEIKEEKTPIIVSMPLWVFIVMQAIIIIIEVLVFYLIYRKKFSK